MNKPVDISDLLTSEQARLYADVAQMPEVKKTWDKNGGRKNRQEYQGSALAGSDIVKEYANNPDRFYNTQEPDFAIVQEKPEHRIIIYLKAQCLSNREIAERLGYTQPWISQVLRQPWAKQRLAEEIKNAGRDALQGVIEAAALDSVYKLIDIRDNKDAPASVQVSAAKELLDRCLGKPTQKVESEVTHKSLPSDVGELEQELASARAEINRLGLTGGPN